MNSFVICRPKTENENKKIINYPLISFKFDEPNIKYTKFEYRQINILQIIMLTPQLFTSLTDEVLQLWHDSYGIQKISSDNKCCYIIFSYSDYSYFNYGFCLEYPKEMNGEEILRKFGYYKVICDEKILKSKLLLSLLLLFLFFI